MRAHYESEYQDSELNKKKPLLRNSKSG